VGASPVDLPNHIGTLTAGKLKEAMHGGDGLATFSCPDEETMIGVAREYGPVMMHRDSDDRGVTPIRETPGRDPKRDIGLTKGALPPHTDRPAITQPPKVLLLWCRRAASEGGEAIVVRASDVVHCLGGRDPGALEALCAPEAVIFRTEGEQRICPVFRMADGDVREVRLRFDPFVHFSYDAARALPALQCAIRDVSRVFGMAPGTGYALRNDIWLHGRAAYSGDRDMSRVMIGS
jgi:Taurine catabolism dioxygenase TauD, TfdA family